ncbi:Uncharacterised protein [Mycobacteroides abscessus subsp. bolletii]|nr:Uncharacterised protein [Mycobacteroides abscessus subsp. bolletii]SIJ24641.1 Uncharacterised protein [Mycobacteroides abscessus subsp. bolletii]SKS85239.1 Uncharacterised protein [Mycobacteroides abscessus subsp. bolletii]SKT09396.1 Uncharacterised protein [Mycobacteroides abscessus subsp. bolletii]SKX88884.1 Uncharacterised protein [Mycobacteroides abscessus subsp. bolletii]
MAAITLPAPLVAEIFGCSYQVARLHGQGEEAV